MLSNITRRRVEASTQLALASISLAALLYPPLGPVGVGLKWCLAAYAFCRAWR